MLDAVVTTDFLHPTQETLLGLDNLVDLRKQVKDLARERNALILAHNYQIPEIQDVADFVGDSLALSQRAAQAQDVELIVFCGVHFMAETAAVLNPNTPVVIPDLEAGCSLADSITAEELAAWQAQHPAAVTVMYVNTTAAVKALTDYCVTSSNAVAVVKHILDTRGEDTESLFGPDMFLGAHVERQLGIKMNVWLGECHVHAGIRPSDINHMLEENPGAELMIHPECGCSTAFLEQAGAGDIPASNVSFLSTGGMMTHAVDSPAEKFLVATETGMIYPLEKENPSKEFIPVNEQAYCRFMKMITLPKLRDTLLDRDNHNLVEVAPEVASMAAIPIRRMVEINP